VSRWFQACRTTRQIAVVRGNERAVFFGGFLVTTADVCVELGAGQSYVGHDGMEVPQLRLGLVVVLDVCFITVLNVL